MLALTDTNRKQAGPESRMAAVSGNPELCYAFAARTGDAGR